jgi:hypothetical protein
LKPQKIQNMKDTVKIPLITHPAIKRFYVFIDWSLYYCDI